MMIDLSVKAENTKTKRKHNIFMTLDQAESYQNTKISKQKKKTDKLGFIKINFSNDTFKKMKW